MNSITITAMVDEKRRVMIDLPDEVEPGLVELEVIVRRVEDEKPPEPLTREWVEARLRAAGLLVEHEVFDDALEVDEAELRRLGEVFASDRPMSELIDENREERF